MWMIIEINSMLSDILKKFLSGSLFFFFVCVCVCVCVCVRVCVWLQGFLIHEMLREE